MADQAQDPLLVALRLRYRSAMLLRRGENGLALRVLGRAHQVLNQAEDAGSVAALAVSGTLHLAAAISSAQARDHDAVKGSIAEAARIAEQIGRDVPAVYWSAFGITNVAHFTVASEIEMGNLGQATRTGKSLRFPVGHPRARVGRYHIEMARAFAQMGKAPQAERHLHLAREAAPQQARYHPYVRDTIGVLVRRQRRAPEGLCALATWVGL
uniref:Transcriptional regulator n=1 Tax=Streptomyces sp. ML694-90F3 TaxID=1265536 RepID=A0A077KRC6_9ACTN|nr:transcriptional regulator [Streptomyces sp. ML694-90F3]